MREIGRKTWAIAEGYIPSDSVSDKRSLKSHETVCILASGARPGKAAAGDGGRAGRHSRRRRTLP